MSMTINVSLKGKAQELYLLHLQRCRLCNGRTSSIIAHVLKRAAAYDALIDTQTKDTINNVTEE